MIFRSGKAVHPRFQANFRLFDAQDFVAELCGFIRRRGSTTTMTTTTTTTDQEPE